MNVPRLGFCLCACLIAGQASADPRAEQAPASPDPEAAPLDQLTTEFKKLGDWEEQYRIIDRSMQSVWARNGWNSESDRYALDTLREVARIPPWEFTRRLDTLADRTAERYGLPPNETARLKARLYGEAFGFVWNNAGVLIRQTRESIEARVRGEPYTPDQIARWTEESDPLMEDMRRRVEGLGEDFAGSIDEEHRHLYEADMESFDHRMKTLDGLRESWAQGKWKAEDWGLEEDPIQNGALRPAEGKQPASAPAAPPEGRDRVPDAGDPSTWATYVRQFVRKYHLDPGQTKAAESILVELTDRANSYMRANAVNSAKPSAAGPPDHDILAPVPAMFAELKARLERIPTATQRARAEAQPVVSE